MSHLSRLRAGVLASLGTVSSCAGSDRDGVSVSLPEPASEAPPVGEGPAPQRHAQGYVKESDGSVHRATAVTCDPGNHKDACRGDEGHKGCSTDADCQERAHGKCVTGSGQIGTFCGCEYACASDADCKAGQACVCAEHSGQSRSVCAEAACRTDADCASGVCGVSAHFNGCFTDTRLACRTAEDRCRSDADCREGGRGPGGACRAGRDGWSCQHVSCAIGRPFTVEGAARTAHGATRGDWLDGALVRAVEAEVGALSPADRERLGRHAREVAAMEHASVASFARASLELLALGAPPDLVARSHAAAADEVRHAQIAFSIARAMDGRAAGPGPLDLSGALRGAGAPEGFARALAREGCAGETLGAAEARGAAEGTASPALRALWTSVADDEEAHATLAWRTLAWAIATFGSAAREAAARGLEEGLRELLAVGGEDRGAPAAGVLGSAARGAIRAATAREVVLPAAAALGIAITPPEA